MNRPFHFARVSATSTLLALVLGLTGCVSNLNAGAFSYSFADNDADDFLPVLEALPAPSSASTTNASGASLMVAVTHGEGPEVLAVQLPGGEIRWRTPLDAMTRPEVLGDVVVTSVRDAIVALDLGSGRELWRKPVGTLTYLGAARNGDRISVVTSTGAGGGATRVGRIECVNARDGRRLWNHEIAGILGHPTSAGTYVLVPWDRQSIAFIDVNTGLESARLRTNDDVIAWVEARAEGVYYGHRNLYRMGPGSVSGNRPEAEHRAPPVADLPRDPELHEDGFFPAPGRRSARGRIRVHFAPAAPGAEGPVAVAGDRFYYVYFRYVFAYDGNGTLVWATKLPEDVVNAAVTPEGLFVAGQEGLLAVLHAQTGQLAFEGHIDASLASAGLDAAALVTGANAGQPKDLRTSLAEIAGDADNRLVPARAHAVALLSALEEPAITQDLLDLYVQRSTPGALRQAIADALRVRTVGTEHLVAALDQHYDYLEETPAPPLQLIVPALLEQEVRSAVPGLLSHLEDHETPAADLPVVLQGIIALGDESVTPALNAFLTRYKADSTFAETPDPVNASAQGLFVHGGEEGRTRIQAVAADTHTLEPVGVAIRGFFEQEAADAEALAQAEADAAAQAAAEAAAAERAGRPLRLSQAQINEVFVGQTEALRTCVEGELERNPRLGQLRFVFIIENTGRPRDMRVSPPTPDLQSCLAPTLEALVFPRFRQRRQRAMFTIRLQAGDDNANQVAEENGPWWTRQARRGGTANGPMGRPWWQARTIADPNQGNQLTGGDPSGDGTGGGSDGTDPNGGQGGDPAGGSTDQNPDGSGQGGDSGQDGQGSPGDGGQDGQGDGGQGDQGDGGQGGQGDGGQGGDMWWLPSE